MAIHVLVIMIVVQGQNATLDCAGFICLCCESAIHISIIFCLAKLKFVLIYSRSEEWSEDGWTSLGTTIYYNS